MCQLLGISANKEVDINFSLKEFKYRGKQNPHGWGFAFFENGQWKINKKPSSLYNQDITQKQFKFKSKIIIGHIRLASCGEKSHDNTHPFNIENWVFAHNGTVNDIKSFQLEKYKPQGETDSEYAFCYLFEKIKANPDRILEILKNESEKIKKYGYFNFLMSDGEFLYAFGDNSLYYTQRKSPFRFAKLKDVQYEVNLAEMKSPEEQAIIIATESLSSNEKWIKIEGLKIFGNGELKEKS